MSRIPAYALAKEINGNSYVEELSVIEMAREYCSEIDKLEEKNESLKKRIKDLEDACDGSCFSSEEDDRDKLISELQDQHHQDCIKINRLHVAIDTLVDKYSRLRKTVGMD